MCFTWNKLWLPLGILLSVSMLRGATITISEKCYRDSEEAVMRAYQEQRNATLKKAWMEPERLPIVMTSQTFEPFYKQNIQPLFRVYKGKVAQIARWDEQGKLIRIQGVPASAKTISSEQFLKVCQWDTLLVPFPVSEEGPCGMCDGTGNVVYFPDELEVALKWQAEKHDAHKTKVRTLERKAKALSFQPEYESLYGLKPCCWTEMHTSSSDYRHVCPICKGSTVVETPSFQEVAVPMRKLREASGIAVSRKGSPLALSTSYGSPHPQNARRKGGEVVKQVEPLWSEIRKVSVQDPMPLVCDSRSLYCYGDRNNWASGPYWRIYQRSRKDLWEFRLDFEMNLGTRNGCLLCLGDDNPYTSLQLWRGGPNLLEIRGPDENTVLAQIELPEGDEQMRKFSIQSTGTKVNISADNRPLYTANADLLGLPLALLQVNKPFGPRGHLAGAAEFDGWRLYAPERQTAAIDRLRAAPPDPDCPKDMVLIASNSTLRTRDAHMNIPYWSFLELGLRNVQTFELMVDMTLGEQTGTILCVGSDRSMKGLTLWRGIKPHSLEVHDWDTEPALATYNVPEGDTRVHRYTLRCQEGSVAFLIDGVQMGTFDAALLDLPLLMIQVNQLFRTSTEHGAATLKQWKLFAPNFDDVLKTPPPKTSSRRAKATVNTSRDDSEVPALGVPVSPDYNHPPRNY